MEIYLLSHHLGINGTYTGVRIPAGTLVHSNILPLLPHRPPPHPPPTALTPNDLGLHVPDAEETDHEGRDRY